MLFFPFGHSQPLFYHSTCFWDLWLLTTTCLLMNFVLVSLIQSSLLGFRFVYPTCLPTTSIDCHTGISKSIDPKLKWALFSQNSVPCIYSVAKVGNLGFTPYFSFNCHILFTLPHKYFWSPFSFLCSLCHCSIDASSSYTWYFAIAFSRVFLISISPLLMVSQSDIQIHKSYHVRALIKISQWPSSYG